MIVSSQMQLFDLKLFMPIGHNSARSRKEMAHREHWQNRFCSNHGLCSKRIALASAWMAAGIGQYICGAALAERQARRRISQRLCHCTRTATGADGILFILQQRTNTPIIGLQNAGCHISNSKRRRSKNRGQIQREKTASRSIRTRAALCRCGLIGYHLKLAPLLS